MVLRKGSTSELTGPFAAENFPVFKTLPGVAKDSHGDPLVSGETGRHNQAERGLCDAHLSLLLWFICCCCMHQRLSLLIILVTSVQRIPEI